MRISKDFIIGILLSVSVYAVWLLSRPIDLSLFGLFGDDDDDDSDEDEPEPTPEPTYSLDDIMK